jgi:hypothetical protein
MYAVRNRRCPKAQLAAGYLDFKRFSKKRAWKATEGGNRVRWKAYAMNLGRATVDSVGLELG